MSNFSAMAYAERVRKTEEERERERDERGEEEKKEKVFEPSFELLPPLFVLLHWQNWQLKIHNSVKEGTINHTKLAECVREK